MTYKFTERAEKSISIANEIAIELGHSYIGTEHLLYGLLKEGKGIASKILENQNLKENIIREKIEELIGVEEKKEKKTVSFTPRTKRVIENAFKESKKVRSDYIGTEHLLIGIIRETDSIAIRILMDLDINLQKLYNEIIKVINEYDNLDEKNKNKESDNKCNSTQVLNQFGNDLSRLALEGKLDPVIGRSKEIERIIQILSRRTKNNPCLIGEPGVRENSGN